MFCAKLPPAVFRVRLLASLRHSGEADSQHQERFQNALIAARARASEILGRELPVCVPRKCVKAS